VVSDSELIERMARGDREAFAALYRRRQGAIYRFALRMCGSQAAAEDIAQDVFLTLIRQPLGYDPARGSVAAFLYGIARKLVLRRSGREQPLEEDADAVASGEHPDMELVRAEAVESVRAAVLALPLHYREAVVLCELEEMEYAEAAAALGCAVGTVRSRLHRARQMLAKRLRPAGCPL
jgi:RNA polymerase sigma-70 factor, ECF subfamily